MPISHKDKLVFIHIPKNGGTSITEYFNMADKGHHNINYYNKKYKNIIGDYQSFAVIRNPWDRVVSNYNYAIMENSYYHSKDGRAIYGIHPDYELLKDKTLTECIKLLERDPHLFKHQGWLPQSNWICDNGKILVDQVIKYNNINTHFKMLGHDIPKLNQSEKTHLNDNLNIDNLIQVVKRIYQKDIKIFDLKINE
jgi:hypothetical protein